MRPERSIGPVISKCGDAILRGIGGKSRGSADASQKWSAVGRGKARQARAPQGQGCSRVGSRSFCIACGSMEPSSAGRKRCCPGESDYRVPLPNGGKRRPSRDEAMVSSTDFLRASRRTTAILAVNRQRHLAPSYGGGLPYRGENSGPGKDDHWKAALNPRSREQNLPPSRHQFSQTTGERHISPGSCGCTVCSP